MRPKIAEAAAVLAVPARSRGLRLGAPFDGRRLHGELGYMSLNEVKER